MTRIHSPVRLWSASDLYALLAAKTPDPELVTLFVNQGTFNEDEIRVLRKLPPMKVYRVTCFDDDDGIYEFRAPEDEAAVWFLGEAMSEPPLRLCEVITTFREIEL